ncbi:hypothetical protein FO519_005464 [Halicephalobus sp. NKZ332]|nr:hypothetical protein FO519_005464 [Halicephalobus sp. NKZ332]
MDKKSNDTMSVDYSPYEYQNSRAIIDTAARLALSQNENVRVRNIGNQMVISEHRDPFSFYWQMDKIRPIEEDLPLRVPRADYVVEVEENQYSELQKAQEVRELPMVRVEDPSGFSHYWHVDAASIKREQQYVQVEFEPEPEIIQELPPPQPVIEEHIFRQTTTKRIVENRDEENEQIIREVPRNNIRIPSRSPRNRRRILREFRPVAYT